MSINSKEQAVSKPDAHPLLSPTPLHHLTPDFFRTPLIRTPRISGQITAVPGHPDKRGCTVLPIFSTPDGHLEFFQIFKMVCTCLDKYFMMS